MLETREKIQILIRAFKYARKSKISLICSGCILSRFSLRDPEFYCDLQNVSSANMVSHCIGTGYFKEAFLS